MTVYRPDPQQVPGQTSLLDPPPPKPRPHQTARLAVLQALEQTSAPVTAHDLSPTVRSPSNCVAKRLGELEADGHCRRIEQITGPYGQPVWTWEPTT